MKKHVVTVPSDAYHSIIQPSLTVTVTDEYQCQMFLLIHFEIQELLSHNNNKHTNSARNISRRFCKFPDLQDFNEEK